MKSNLFEAVVRRDGSSNFSREHQYATFPSVSLGWVLTREKFMENRPSWLDLSKIRLSWGQNGNGNVLAPFALLQVMMSQGKECSHKWKGIYGHAAQWLCQCRFEMGDLRTDRLGY